MLRRQKLIPLVSAFFLLPVLSAFAQERGSVSTADSREIYRGEGYLADERIGIKPQAGVLFFNKPAEDLVSDDSTQRAVYGATLDINVAEAGSPIFFGPSTGVFYSSIGSPNASFFGAGGSGADSHAFIVPANLKLGFNLSPGFRVSAHGGVNAIYRSAAGTISAGESIESDDKWSLYPNVGADIELGLGSQAALILRPDITLTSGNDILGATIGLSIFAG